MEMEAVDRSSGSRNNFSLPDSQAQGSSKTASTTDRITSMEEGCCLWEMAKTAGRVVSAPFRWIGNFFYNLFCCSRGNKGNEEKNRISGTTPAPVHDEVSGIEKEIAAGRTPPSVHEEASEEESLSEEERRVEEDPAPSANPINPLEINSGGRTPPSVHEEASEEESLSEEERRVEEDPAPSANPINPLEINYAVIKDEALKRRFSAFWEKETDSVKAERPTSFIFNPKREHHLANRPAPAPYVVQKEPEKAHEENLLKAEEGEESAPPVERLSLLISSRNSVDSKEDEVESLTTEEEKKLFEGLVEIPIVEESEEDKLQPTPPETNLCTIS